MHKKNSVNSDSNHFEVIISGAGPTGLMLANLLNHFNINFLIIDKKSGPTLESRALAVQSRSLEIYEQLELSDQVLVEGQKAFGVSLMKNAKQVGFAGFLMEGSEISPFPFAMIYEQSKNESLLYKNLLNEGKEVLWNSGVSGYEKSGIGYSVRITDENDLSQNYTCNYIAACDGSKSIIREISGMPFEGGTYENVFYVADTHAKTGTDHDMLMLFLSKLSIVLFFPMQGENRYRILGILPKEFYHQEEIHFSEIAEHLQKKEKIPYDYFNTSWYSTYKLHHKKVKRFNEGNVFFCGDAAHVHSPAGGQGMNTGLQDAYNLAWKLAFVINGKAKSELLETYNEEREPNAVSLLKTTDRFFSVMIKPGKFFVLIRLWILPFIFPLISKIRFIQKIMFSFVSQTRINYNSSSLSYGKAGSITGGMRFPWFKYFDNGNERSIYISIRERSKINFTLISYGIKSMINPSELYNLIEIEKNETNDKILNKKGFSESWMALVRPDNYICYISDHEDIPGMNEYLNKYFI
ncbi:FAD-dependent monooxygenase [soil metagenome]